MMEHEILSRLDDIDQKVDNEARLASSEFAFLQMLRDRLSQLVHPASNLTVAYTTLVTQGGASGRKQLARVGLAATAYPNLLWRARRHRWSNVAFLILAIAFTYVAVDLSVQVATGKYVLQTLDVLNARRDAIASEEQKLEASLNGPLGSLKTAGDLVHADGSVDMRAFRVCDRSELYAQTVMDRLKDAAQVSTLPNKTELIATGDLLQKHLSTTGKTEDPITLRSDPEERKLCGLDDVLKVDFRIAHRTVASWIACGSAQIGGIFFFVDQRILGPIGTLIWGTDYGVCTPYLTAYNRDQQSNVTTDVELQIPPKVLAVGNYLLPVVFSLLGSLLFVILEYYNKVRTSVLSPSDSWLSWIRLVLGVAVGACIGLFFTSYAPSTPPLQSPETGGGTALIASLSLSASGLAFLAGFGVEGVFTMLQQLVGRIFAIDSNATGSSSSTR
jgi:hypothetical protein